MQSASIYKKGIIILTSNSNVDSISELFKNSNPYYPPNIIIDDKEISEEIEVTNTTAIQNKQHSFSLSYKDSNIDRTSITIDFLSIQIENETIERECTIDSEENKPLKISCNYKFYVIGNYSVFSIITATTEDCSNLVFRSKSTFKMM